MAIKRFFSSISASFEQLVNQMENHQAVADTAIAEAKQALARLRAQRNMTENKINQLHNNIQRATTTAAQWRARALAEKNDSQAIECLKAMQQQDNSIKFFQQQLAQQNALLTQLQQYQEEAEQHLSAMQLKRTELSARNTRTQLLQQGELSNVDLNVDNIFTRWEMSVLEKECHTPTNSAELALHNHYNKIEEDQHLSQLLQSMRSHSREQ